MDFDDGPERYDFRPEDEGAELSEDVQNAVERLRETLTYDMALRAFQCRTGEEPSSDAELEAFMDDLIVDAFNAGYDEWEEEFLYYD